MEIQRQILTEDSIKLAAKEISERTGLKELNLLGSGSFIAFANPHSQGQVELTKTYDLDFSVRSSDISPAVIGKTVGELGRGSAFSEDNGFYIEVLPTEFHEMPDGWESRAKPIKFDDVKVLAISPSDLAVNKLLATRSKDLEFVASLERESVVSREELREIAKDLGVVDGVNKQGQLELSLAGVDLVHARDSAEYSQKVEGFLETLFDAKKSGDGSLSLTANALFENAFQFPEGNTTVDHTLNTSAFLRGEITAKEMGVKIGKEEVKALQRLATVQSYEIGR